ncbi:ThiF family adenylyltransferase [Herbidospora mongoliensis]|uniref:ThiF family adenylyltransferase n=1 Tax=Herbidospora mongoliensis TaxID=688067 RepID=UPI00083258CF|nr:ThiF family adenylyltransferase [Herbidospora mongoliensis]
MTLNTERIDHLLDGFDAGQVQITLVGLGSGGASLLQPLVMSGLRRWHLFDPDVLEPVNLVKHPATRSSLGRPKVEVMRDWILDRNPGAEVNAHQADVMSAAAFDEAALSSKLVICAVDDAVARGWLNARCVELRLPCLTGSVIRTGLGGQVYLYVPGQTGCFSCVQLVADRNQANLEDVLDLTEEERHHRYGLGDSHFTTSGLAVDIAIVAALQAHMAWSVVAGGRSRYVPRLNFNWMTMGIRPEKGVFTSHYQTKRLLVQAQHDCLLKCGGEQA